MSFKTEVDRQPRIPLSAPNIAGNEWRYVKECLDAGWVSSAGPFVERFEREFAAAVGSAHAVATASGTAALHIALLVAGVERDDEVLVSTLTFIAPGNAVRYVGAWPVFIDAEPQYWQMDPAAVERFLDQECVLENGTLRNRRSGRRVKAILPVHILGHPVDISPIVAAARRYGLAVVEDATESLGATYDGIPVGRFGVASCFSFNGNKLITTGGGGMIVTDDERIAERAKYLTTQAKDDPVEYVHGTIGYNYRLTNVQAAIGCAQLEQLSSGLAVKRQIAERYQAGLIEVPGITCMPESPRARSAFWLNTVLVDRTRYGSSSRDLMAVLHREGIEARPLWQPLHLSPAHSDHGHAPCSTAERLWANALSLPSSLTLTKEQLSKVVDVIVATAHQNFSSAEVNV
jgi:perosamine synthetase